MVKRNDLSQRHSTLKKTRKTPTSISRMPVKKEAAASTTELHLVCFSLANQEYGVDIYQVQEIVRLPRLTDVPDSPTYIRGVVDLRSKTIPVIDSRTLLGFPEAKYDNKTRMIIIDRGGVSAGLIVDDVTEVLRGRFEQVSRRAEKTNGRKREFMNGLFKLGDKSVTVINCDRVLGF